MRLTRESYVERFEPLRRVEEQRGGLGTTPEVECDLPPEALRRCLFERVQRVARKEKRTFRSLTEQGLRLVLKEKQKKPGKLPPLVTVRGRGLSDEFKNAPWEKFRAEIYRGRGA